jgi:glycosyltransferase involved in cell wall biosynthesis
MDSGNEEARLIEQHMREFVGKIEKVCIINTYFPPFPPEARHNRGSIELGITNLALWLSKNYDVFIISKHSIRGRPPFNDSEWNGMKICRIGTYQPYMEERNQVVNGIRFMANELLNLSTLWKILRILKTEKPSAVLIGENRQISLASLIAPRILRIPFFVRYDWLCPMYPKEHACRIGERIAGCGECIERNLLLKLTKPIKLGAGLFSSVVYLLKKGLWNSSAAIFPVNEFYAQLYRDWGIKSDKIKVVRTSHELPHPSIYNYYEDLLREKSESSLKMLLYAGRLSPEKGIPTLLDAFRILKQKRMKLLIAGDGILRDKVEEEAKHNPEIMFLGWQNDEQLAELYTIADIVVIPSIVPEGHPVVAEEAMQFHKPIIGFGLGGLRKILEEYPQGIVADEVSAHSLAEAIAQFIDETPTG